MLDFADLLKKAGSRVAAWYIAKTARTSVVQGYFTIFHPRQTTRISSRPPMARRGSAGCRYYRNLPLDASRGQGRKVPILARPPGQSASSRDMNQ